MWIFGRVYYFVCLNISRLSHSVRSTHQQNDTLYIRWIYNRYGWWMNAYIYRLFVIFDVSVVLVNIDIADDDDDTLCFGEWIKSFIFYWQKEIHIIHEWMNRIWIANVCKMRARSVQLYFFIWEILHVFWLFAEKKCSFEMAIVLLCFGHYWFCSPLNFGW